MWNGRTALHFSYSSREQKNEGFVGYRQSTHFCTFLPQQFKFRKKVSFSWQMFLFFQEDKKIYLKTGKFKNCFKRQFLIIKI
jgi:hypothetical protein